MNFFFSVLAMILDEIILLHKQCLCSNNNSKNILDKKSDKVELRVEIGKRDCSCQGGTLTDKREKLL